MSDDPRSFNTPALQSLSADDLDQLGRAIISLTKELSIVSDRLRTLEGLLAKQDLIGAGAVDHHEPDAALTAAIDAARKQILTSVMDALTSD